MSRRMHGGEVLARSSCARHARVIRLRVSIAMLRLGCLYSELRLGCFYSELRLRSSMTKCLVRSIADEKKKEEALLRVLLFR